jgi:hypothetical protein
VSKVRIAALALAFGSWLVAIPLLSAAGSQPPSPTDWRYYNGDIAGKRFAELRQITPQNVSRLGVTCSILLGDDGAFETAPLVIGRTMYLTTEHDDGSVRRRIVREALGEPLHACSALCLSRKSWRRDPGQPCLPWHRRRPPHGARRDERSRAVEDQGRRSGGRHVLEFRAASVERSRLHRHRGQRLGRARSDDGVRPRHRPARLAVSHRSLAVGDRRRHVGQSAFCSDRRRRDVVVIHARPGQRRTVRAGRKSGAGLGCQEPPREPTCSPIQRSC